MKTITAEAIVSAHKVSTAQAYGTVVLVKNIYGTPFSFHYDTEMTAQKIANEIKDLIA